AELIDRAQHDLALKGLHGHAMRDEVVCQILEQFRIRGALAGGSKVTRRVHDPRSEMCFPDSIDENSHCERLFCDRFGKFQAAASLRERLRVAFGKKTEEVTRNCGPGRVVRVSPERDLNIFRLLGILNAMNERIMGFHLLADRVDVALNVFDSRLSFSANAALESPSAEQEYAGISLAVAHGHGIRIFLVLQLALKDL